MTDVDLHIRCQRCGTEMEMRDPGPGMAWTPDQFWVCPRCGRHFWSTYPPPNREKTKACRADVMNHLSLSPLMNPYVLDDDEPDELDDDDDDD